MTARKRISTRERARLFALHGGICHLCKGAIDGSREAWDISHEIPLAQGGADDDANRLLAHRKCHQSHTATVDLPNIAKAKRREAISTGAKAPPAVNIKSRGFTTPDKKPSTTRQPEKLAALPRRAMFR